MAPSQAHDHVVLTRSLASAIAEASRRQREHALKSRPAHSLTTPRPGAQNGIDTGATCEEAVAQQRTAAASRARAREMLTANREMKARIETLHVRIGAFGRRRDRRPAYRPASPFSADRELSPRIGSQ